MAEISAVAVFGEQVRSGEFGKQAAGTGRAARCEAGSGHGGDVGAGVQAKKPEHARGGRTEVSVRPGEHRADVSGGVAGIEGVKTAGGVA
jgi:hypothetical protein